MPSAARVAETLLLLFPESFRRRHGRDLVDLYAEFERAGRRPRLLAVLWDLTTTAIVVRWEVLCSATDHPRVPDRQGDPLMHGVVQDVRCTLRGLRRAPAFAAIAIATLALGIGANAAIFSLVHGVLLRALDVAAPDRTVMVWHRHLEGDFLRNSLTPGNFRDLHEQTDAFEAFAAFGYSDGVLDVGDGQGQRLEILTVTGEFFRVAGVAPMIGRLLDPSDDHAGATPTVVLAYELWRRAFAGDPQVLGSRVRINGSEVSVVGVMPPGFRLARGSVDAYLAMRWGPAMANNRDEYSFRSVGLLAAGVSADAANAQLDAVMDNLRAEYPTENRNLGANVTLLQDDLVRNVRRPLWLVMGAVGIVLLIGCVNLAHLFLARSESRRHEIAIRRALGASTGRLARLALVESLSLTAAGGLLGLALAKALLPVVTSVLPGSVPRLDTVAVDPAVIALTAGVSILTGLCFGLLPAIRLPRLCRPRLGRLRSGRLRSGRRATVGQTSGVLTIAEVALAVMLLSAAGLLVRTLSASAAVDPGYAVENVLAWRVNTSAVTHDPEVRLQMLAALQERLRSLPGVEGVATAIFLPPEGAWNSAWFRRADRPMATDETPPFLSYNAVLPGYFDSLGMRPIAGRSFEPGDGQAGRHVAILNRAAAELHFPDIEPLGRRVILGPDGTFPEAEVVGIVDDGHNALLVDEQQPMIYIPYASLPYWTDLAFAVRTSVPPTTLGPAIRAAVSEQSTAATVYDVATFEQLLADQLTTTRALSRLLGGFAILGLVMAAVGLFGVLSYAVSRRSREFGIRLALGSTASGLRRLVIWQGLSRVVVGLVLGLVGALAGSHLLDGMIRGVTTTDPLTHGTVAGILLLVAVLAAWIPAERASRIDAAPMLRSE